MKKEIIPFRALVCHLTGKGSVGRPRRRWIDNIDSIEQDSEDQGLQGTWTERAPDRIGWRRMVAALGSRTRFEYSWLYLMLKKLSKVLLFKMKKINI